MHVLCNVLIHVWKEANSLHKYLIWTFYIPTSHISINCKTYLWAPDLQPPWKRSPSLPLRLLFLHKNTQHKALGRLRLSMINLWKPPRAGAHVSLWLWRGLEDVMGQRRVVTDSRVASHLTVTPASVGLCDQRGAGGHGTSSIKPRGLTLRLLQIARGGRQSMSSKIKPRTKLTKMKQRVQNWIWIPIMINTTAQGAKKGLFVGSGFSEGRQVEPFCVGWYGTRGPTANEKQIHVHLVSRSFVSHTPKPQDVILNVTRWRRLTEESTKCRQQPEPQWVCVTVCRGGRFHLLIKFYETTECCTCRNILSWDKQLWGRFGYKWESKQYKCQ